MLTKRTMKWLALALLCCAGLLPAAGGTQSATQQKPWLLEVHGGAGDITRATTTPAQDKVFRATLTQAIQAGGKVLDGGGSSLQAVETAIRILEDSGLFDSGKGAIYNAAGFNELDAAIMDGKTLRAGSVAGVRSAKHPITLARAVMEQTPHVMLVGSGADLFLANTHGEQVPPLYYFNEGKWQSLVGQLKHEGKPIPPRPEGAPPVPAAASSGLAQVDANERPKRHYGTVGVVALDRGGNLAAGTSTGGSQGKLPGRVGDSPIIGAGTYAANESCAVSATGVGEYFIRLTIAREVCALVQYKGMPLQAAADEIIHKRLQRLDGVGGLIAITPDGQAVWSYNTPGMYRARLRQGGAVELSIYNDEP